MTLTAVLIRHAKSSWDDPLIDDHDRPLTPRGKRSAEAVGKWLSARGHNPGEVLCSTARRTRDTWDGLAPYLGDARVSYRDDLYHASAGALFDALRGAQAPIVALIAHNPGMADLAIALAETRPNHPDFERYPTAATTVISFSAGAWSEIEPRTGNIEGFVVPRELT